MGKGTMLTMFLPDTSYVQIYVKLYFSHAVHQQIIFCINFLKLENIVEISVFQMAYVLLAKALA